MKYDDASWHYGGEFPEGLPESSGATHIAMFVSWAVLNGLASEQHTKDLADDLRKLQERSVTPTEWFLSACDEKFTSEDLNVEGNRFAAAYYEKKDGFMRDYAETFPDGDTLYDVADSWETFSRLSTVLDSRLEAWRNNKKRTRKNKAS